MRIAVESELDQALRFGNGIKDLPGKYLLAYRYATDLTSVSPTNRVALAAVLFDEAGIDMSEDELRGLFGESAAA